MAERSKAAVLKTVSGVTHSGVRIPLPPPPNLQILKYFLAHFVGVPKTCPNFIGPPLFFASAPALSKRAA